MAPIGIDPKEPRSIRGENVYGPYPKVSPTEDLDQTVAYAFDEKWCFRNKRWCRGHVRDV